MALEEFINEYFVKPIWDRSGYNTINTLAYALIALVAAYALFRLLKKVGIKIDRQFVFSILPFVLLGATMRVVTDAIDTGVMQTQREALFGLIGKIIDSGVYNYSPLTVTPGIYVVVGAITIACVLACWLAKRMDLLAPVGLVLWLSQLLLLIPLMQHFSYVLAIIALAVFGAALGTLAMRKLGVKDTLGSLVVFAHALDGAATFIILDFFNKFAAGAQYMEQHVLSRAIGEAFGTMFTFYGIKVLFATAAVIMLEKEAGDEPEKNYVIL
ncbi:MAG: DUF63 family protein, partial [Candidatus Micrarchaeota archaeon]